MSEKDPYRASEVRSGPTKIIQLVSAGECGHLYGLCENGHVWIASASYKAWGVHQEWRPVQFLPKDEFDANGHRR